MPKMTLRTPRSTPRSKGKLDMGRMRLALRAAISRAGKVIPKEPEGLPTDGSSPPTPPDPCIPLLFVQLTIHFGPHPANLSNASYLIELVRGLTLPAADAALAQSLSIGPMAWVPPIARLTVHTLTIQSATLGGCLSGGAFGYYDDRAARYTMGADNIGYLDGHTESDDPMHAEQLRDIGYYGAAPYDRTSGGPGPSGAYGCDGAFGCEISGSDPMDPSGLQ